MALRISVFIILLLAVAMSPWWVSALGLLVALVTFAPYWEGLILALLFDVAYGYSALEPTPFLATLVTLLAISLIAMLRRMVIFYS